MTPRFVLGVLLAAMALPAVADDPPAPGEPGWFRDNLGPGSGINTAFEALRNIEDLYRQHRHLDASDAQYEPDMSGQGAPAVPYTLCRGNAECTSCYEDANARLYTMRYNLERLRIAGQSTNDYVKSAIAVGDGLSGMTGYAALEWQTQRVRINRQFDGFKRTYDNKYEGMMTSLRDVLSRWDRCERQFGMPDWYNRFGFLYMTFMQDKYKRNF